MPDHSLDVHMLRTYVWLRRVLVIVTTLFLLALLQERVTKAGEQPNSISAYYYYQELGCPLKLLFVATLSCVGVLLIVYQGYTDGENRALNIAGYALLGVAYFPMDDPKSSDPMSTRATIHYASALIFFACLAIVSWCYAHNTLSLVSTESRQNHYRRLYRFSGILMVVLPLVAVIAGYQFRLTSTVFWAEVGGVVAFLVYWFVKSVELEATGAELRGRYTRLDATL